MHKVEWEVADHFRRSRSMERSSAWRATQLTDVMLHVYRHGRAATMSDDDLG
jgi:hypothetical protein